MALVLDPPLSDEIDGLRRALGDRARTRISPHLTLISPVNVAEDDLGAVLRLLRDAAASVPGPLRLVLGPPATFLPDNPVLYLAVAGEGMEALSRLRRVVHDGPLARPSSWPWVPHVTLGDDVNPTRIRAALTTLDRYVVDTTATRVVLLQEQIKARGEPGGDDAPLRRWEPLADAALGPRAIVGRGGLEIELTTGRMIDPEAQRLLADLSPGDRHPQAPGSPPQERRDERRDPAEERRDDRWDPAEELGDPATSGGGRAPYPVVCTARREGLVVGLGVAWQRGGRGSLAVVVPPAHRGQGIGATVLGRLEAVLAETDWEGPPLHAVGPARFYRGRSSRTYSNTEE